MDNKFAKNLAIVAVFLIFAISAIHRHNPKNIEGVGIAGVTIKVDQASEEGERERGLSGRSSLKENEGMLFVFKRPGSHPFWMKDMKFPIDIIWIGENLRVVYIKKNALPASFPESYGSESSDARYVLEVVSGFSDKNKLKIGDGVKFTY